METRNPHWRLLILPVAFALVCVLLTVAAYTLFGGTVPLAPEGYRVSIRLAEATNLVPGSDVQISGVKVGKVVTITRVGNHPKVTIELARPYVPLRTDAQAIARTKTLLGEGYIEIAPGPRTAAAIPDGGQLSPSHVQTTVQLDQFLSTFGPGTRAQLGQLFTGLASAFGGQETALNDAAGTSAELTDNTRMLLDVLDAQRSQLGQLIRTSGEVLGAAGDRMGPLRAAVENGDAVLSTTAREGAGMQATLKALPPLLGQLTTTAGVLNRADPSLHAAVSSLEPVAPTLPRALTTIRSAAPHFRALFDELPATLQAGRANLPALGPTLAAAREGFKQFYPTSRELIPIVQLLASYNTLLSVVANTGGMFSGSYAGPGGVVSNYATGVVSLWNETISGWTKKLPTNRQNPYPTPTALLGLAKNGYIDAYDCRNIHNPLLLPSTFNGVPPCVTQGPWLFNGKKSYYPRLTLAPK
jgi:virulence factor Mce-like protein